MSAGAAVSGGGVRAAILEAIDGPMICAGCDAGDPTSVIRLNRKTAVRRGGGAEPLVLLCQECAAAYDKAEDEYMEERTA